MKEGREMNDFQTLKEYGKLKDWVSVGFYRTFCFLLLIVFGPIVIIGFVIQGVGGLVLLIAEFLKKCIIKITGFENTRNRIRERIKEANLNLD